MKHRSVGGGLAALLALASCGKAGEGVADVLLVASVEVVPASGSVVLGGTAQLTATPRTASGLVVPGRAVTWVSSNSAAVSVSDAGAITAQALGGPVRITATVDGVSGESQITVQPFPIARIGITPNQAAVLVGGSFELVATAYDAQGAPLPDRVLFWQSSAPATAAVTSTGIVLGMAEGGPVTITVTAEGKSATATVTVAPRPATHLGFVQEPSAATAGQPISPAVRVAIRNDQGGTVSAATTAVTLALSTNPSGATLSGTTTVAAVNGIAIFGDLTLDKAGAGYTLTATAAPLASATSTPFANLAGPPSQLTLTTAPSPVATSGQPLGSQPVLQLRDARGNAVGQAGVVIVAAVASGIATVSGGAATTNSAGTAAFSNLSLTGSGSVTLSFSAPALAAVVSGPITVTAPAAGSLALVTQPSATAQSGTPLAVQPTIQLRDGSGKDVTTAGVAITASLASGPAGGALSGGTVAQTAAGGTATFTGLAVSGPAGSYTLQFSSPGLVSVTSTPVVVSAAPTPATQLGITTQPSSATTSGVALPQQPVLQLRDASGNPVAQSGVAVTASIASGSGTLGGTTTVVTSTSGAAVFTDLAISGPAGDYTLGFASPGLAGAASGVISIAAVPPPPPPSATQLAITTQPSGSAASGTPFGTQPSIQLRDAQGAAVSQSGVPVTVSVATGSATLSGNLTVNTNSTGRATFSGLTLTGPVGAHSLRFSSPGLTDAVSGTINLAAGTAAKLVIVSGPSSTARSGKPFPVQPLVQIQDGSGNLVFKSGISVTAAINSGVGTLRGHRSKNTNGQGVATFDDLEITGLGDFTLRFTATGLTPAVSGTITITP